MTGNETSDNPLEQNCRSEWPLWTCIVGNVCGLTSTTLWFLVLLPQIWKNFRRKSVAGLSFLWGVANFTASLVNLFFVYIYAEIPLYGRINAIYMPILEFTILVQFFIYASVEKRAVIRYVCAVVCFVGWGILILIQLFAKIYPQMQWVAIALWCIETFPQVILNIKLRSTSGQSTRSVTIATIGKMTDFLSTYGLVIPIQYVVMTYFSSSIAYINAIQVAWYYSSETTDVLQDQTNEGFMPGELRMSTSDNDDMESEIITTEGVQYNSICSNMPHRWRNVTCSKSTVRIIRWSAMTYLSMALALFVLGIVWRTDTYFSLFAPLGIIAVLLLTYTYYNTRAFKKFKFSKE